MLAGAAVAVVVSIVALATAPGACAAPLDDARRYAPILWPAPGEPYLPTRPSRFAAFHSAAGGASVGYRRTHAAGGLTIHQYWMYYAWDVGHRGHEHDAETFSVFVDSTGAVVGAAGSAHGPATLNNIVRGRRAARAPLPEHFHVLVEYGKHACAPDVDADGLFEPGIDANLLGGEAWGVQDARARATEDRIFEATSAPPRGARTYALYLVDELRDADARRTTQPPLPLPMAPPDPRRDLWLHRSYEAPQDVLEPWLTDFVAATAGASYDIGGAVSARLGFLWARDGSPLGERAIEPFASYDFASERVGDCGVVVHENRSGGLGLRYGAWGNDGPYRFDWGPAIGATLLRWDRGGISGLGHGDVTIGVDIYPDVAHLGDSRFLVSAGFAIPFFSREPARRLLAR